MSQPAFATKLLQRYLQDDPTTAATNLESLTEEQAADLLEQLPLTLAIRIFAQLSPPFATVVLNAIPENKTRQILEQGGADIVGTLLLSLPDDEKQSFVDKLPQKLKEAAQEALTFPTDSAGAHMKTDFATLRPGIAAGEAIKKLRRASRQRRPKSNIYITDDQQHLIGVMGVRDLYSLPSRL